MAAEEGSTAADLVGFTAAVSAAVDFTPAGSTAASRACTTALTVDTGGTGTMAWHGGRYGWWLAGPGLAWTYYDNPWWNSYPDYGYYDYSQPCANQTSYYCSGGLLPLCSAMQHRLAGGPSQLTPPSSDSPGCLQRQPGETFRG